MFEKINPLNAESRRVKFDKNGNGIVEDGEVVGSKIQFKEILGVGFSYNF